MGIVIVYNIFFFALKKIFGPIEIVVHYKLNRKESTSHKQEHVHQQNIESR